MTDGPRGLRPDELDQLMRDVIGPVYWPEMAKAFPTLFCEENTPNLRIMKVDGKIVTHIGVVVRDMILNGCRIRVGNVGAVSTREDYRKQGHAWAVLEEAMQTFREQGVDMFLISGYRTLYRLHGATHVGTVWGYQALPGLASDRVAVRPFVLEDLPAWAALYQAEPVRFERFYEDFEKLLRRAPEDRGGLCYSIWRGTEPVAYSVLGLRERDGNRSLSINEYAGDRQALLAAVDAWCQEFDVEGVQIGVPAHERTLRSRLEVAGSEGHAHATGGTIALLDFPRLCGKLMLLFEERVGRPLARRLGFHEQEGAYAVSLDGERFEVGDAHDAARLIFGNPADREEEQTTLPETGELAEVLRRIFPVPRPEYGLSYI